MNLFKGLVAGALAGVAASYVMERFQAEWAKAEEAGGGSSPSSGSEDPATVKAADRVALAVTGEPVPPARREQASEIVHYATGAGLGAIYGALSEVAPFLTFGFGAAYGGAVAIGLDETLVPKLGLAKGPKETPPSIHAYGLASHLVYGLTLEGARRVIRVLL
ncbi:MAG: DUF1440 domain-containing protein [Proteobacteria bacterium]|nr:DUF1440 domain-containing protein [Pseudomonadota bacterium]MBW3617110.1 DUF1440 domain-containing protein [Pseudomonadota bacterium]